MADTDVPKQFLHVSLVEHVRNQTIAFSKIEFFIVFGHDPCSILPSVLENG